MLIIRKCALFYRSGNNNMQNEMVASSSHRLHNVACWEGDFCLFIINIIIMMITISWHRGPSPSKACYSKTLITKIMLIYFSSVTLHCRYQGLSWDAHFQGLLFPKHCNKEGWGFVVMPVRAKLSKLSVSKKIFQKQF